MVTLQEGSKVLEDVLRNVRDGMTVSKVFGEPYKRDGTLVIPVAAVRGGGGAGGGGEAADGEGGYGSGGGFGLSARPLGVYVVSEDGVAWEPSLDVSRIALGGQIVGLAALLVVRSLIKARSARLAASSA